ncbi:ground-like domain protein, partial [Cooperia oncophora]
ADDDTNIKTDAPTSKRAIQKAAESEYGGTFDVICSPCEFSFVISSQKYCDGIKDEIACFVFLQPPTILPC